MKRSLAFILSVAIATPLLVPENISKRNEKIVHAATDSVIYGDVNSDGKISILDMILLKSYLTEKNTKGFSTKAADLDGDGNISSKDAIELSMYLMNEIPIFSSEKAVDSDNDGLYDYQEKIIGTDILKKDTDGDGLSDYTEAFLSLTDPLTKDTGNTGISDDKKDNDKDGLNNLDEQKYGTNPLNKDTDGDGIDDKSEISGTGGYISDPTKEDTDFDDLNDYEELRLKLNPSNSSSDGKTADSKRIISQSIKSDNQLLKEINNDSVYQLSIDASVSGYIENSIKIRESSFSTAIDYDGVYGKKIDVDISDKRVLSTDGLKLNFKLSGTDIEKYMVFKYYDDLNMIFPIPTKYDIKNSIVYCTDDTDGTYCLVEKEKWRNMIAATPKSKLRSAETQNNLVLFCTDAVLENQGFNSANYIKKIAKPLFEMSDGDNNLLSMEVGLFGYSKALQKNLTASSYNTKRYFGNYSRLDNFLYVDDFIGLSEYLEMSYSVINPSFLNGSSCMITPMEMALNSSKREDEEFNNIFVFSLSANNYDASIRPDDDVINEILGLNSLHGSYVISKSASDTAKEYYEDLSKTFHGQLFYYDDSEKSISDCICEYIKKETAPIYSQNISYFNYSLFVDPSWKEDVLSGDFSNIENIKDTDGDGFYDIEEINWDLYDDEKTYYDYADESYTKSDKPKKGIEQLFDGAVVETKSFIPFVSDIEEIDTDNDGLSDDEETDIFGTNPRNADTDGDGLPDGLEVDLWFDPLDANPDGDSFGDKEEYENDTDPFVYDYTVAESSEDVIKGALLGDFDVPDTIPGLIGQISASFVPVVADVRDYFANVFVNQNTSAAIWNVAGWSTDFLIGAGVGVDSVKIAPKVGKFVSKFSKDTAKVFDALRNVLKRFPNSNKLVPAIAGAIPSNAYDDIAMSIKDAEVSVTKSGYKAFEEVVEASGKKLNDLIGFIPKVNGELDSKIIKNADDFSKYFKTSPKGLDGRGFEKYLVDSLHGEGSFKTRIPTTGTREFDGKLGDVWWEAKSGRFWLDHATTAKDFGDFRGLMGERKKIADGHGATLEVFSNTPIPDAVKKWLTEKEIPFTEILF